MSHFLVTPAVGNSAITKINYDKGLVVSAVDAAGAIKAANAYRSGDGSLTGGVATALSEVTMATALALVGWRFTITVTTITGAATYTGDATTDTIDEMAAKLVIALNALTGIAGAAYSTKTLTIAETTDALGDQTVVFTIYPPIVLGEDGQQISQDVNMIDEMAGSITHEGSSGDALAITFVGDTVVIPLVLQPV